MTAVRLAAARVRVADALRHPPMHERPLRSRLAVVAAVVAVHPLAAVRWRRHLARLAFNPPRPRPTIPIEVLLPDLPKTHPPDNPEGRGP